MRSLPKPAFNAADVLNACIASIRDASLSGKLTVVANNVVLSETDYLMRGVGMTLYTVAPSDGIAGVLTTAEMRRVYAATFVKSVRTRSMYDALKAAPRNDVCPLCAQRTVSTLDHYLPQTIHANLIIVPINLVPACAECNKGKLDHQPNSEVEQGFHPYFDNFDDAQWLSAEVIEGAPAALRFSVSAPPGWPPAKSARAEAHFKSFRLGELYSSHSGVELNNIRFSLERISHKGTADDIRAFLADRAESARRAYLNSWQTATYQALALSDWFCEGGFLT
ncbi:hypothetical protein [Aurantimonas marina]|uniref:hypothetical protein n=1 Tax=Aurantimonas marina TaxID=2780508 RepID=UPI0019D0FCFC|nr:hypothetical protein [Aurantimonas marina]